MMRHSKSIFAPLTIVLTMLSSTVVLHSNPAEADQPSRVQLVAANQPLPADGPFQVTVEVFSVDGEAKQLQDRHLVLFKDGKAYDFALTEPRDVTVIDPTSGTVTLLSRENHVKATIDNQYIINAIAQFRVYAKNQNLEARLGMDPKIEKTGPTPVGYRATFEDFQYDVVAGVPKNAAWPSRFAEFTDWVARVNLIRKLGTPPFTRMKLGRMLATDGLVPTEITLEIKSPNGQRTFASNYVFKHGLSKEAQKRINEVAGMMTLYREIPLPAFPR